MAYVAGRLFTGALDVYFEALGIPADKGWILAAAVSAGYPTGKWGMATRRPAEEVVYADRWGQPVRWSTAELSGVPSDG